MDTDYLNLSIQNNETEYVLIKDLQNSFSLSH